MNIFRYQVAATSVDLLTGHCEHLKGARQSPRKMRDCFVTLAMTILTTGIQKIIGAFLPILFILVALSHPVDAADTSTVTVSATVVSKNQCKFNSATAALAFGNLDVANPTNKTVNTSITFRCMGSSPMATFFMSDDDGLYETGQNANRMRHTSLGTEYIPYTFTLNPTSGTVPKNTVQALTISGTVYATDYQNAATGTYSDTVVITLSP